MVGNQRTTIGTSGADDDKIVDYQGRAAESEHRDLGVVVLGDIPRPERLPAG